MTANDIRCINEGLKMFEELYGKFGRTPSYLSAIQFMRGYLGIMDINLNILLNMIEDLFRTRGWGMI